MRHCYDVVERVALVLLLVALQTSQTFALDDVGFPIHPKAIPSSITRKSGKGEETKWMMVTFKVNAPYREVVKYYKLKAGRRVQIAETVSEKLLNTLILSGPGPKDQINVNISGQIGKKVTEVEISRNVAGQ